MTTSVCPSDATASADANGSIVRSVPFARLDDANRALTTNSSNVATATVARPRESTFLDPRGIAIFAASGPGVCAADATWPPILNVFGGVHKYRSRSSSDPSGSTVSVAWTRGLPFDIIGFLRITLFAPDEHWVSHDERSAMRIASRGATMAVDWEQ